MNVRKPLNDLLAKDMDRKEFLAHMGAGLLALVGITHLMNALTHASTSRSSAAQRSGYGSSPYGK